MFIFLIRHWRWSLTIFAILLLALAIFMYVFKSTTFVSASIESNDRIDETANQVVGVKKIGKWEFLSMQIEEIVDTTRSRFLISDDNLIRIYRGTIRLGVDMETLSDDWFQAKGDTAIVQLPAIKQLNEQFIDEAQTETFGESGTWDGKAREALYRKAERLMKLRLVKSDAYQQAEENGKDQMENLMHSFGYKVAVVTFGK